MSWQAGLMNPSSAPMEIDFYSTWRVGLLIPSPNSVMEVDFYRSLPHDTTLHTARMYVADGTPASEERMLDEYALPAAATIATVLPHIVVFGSTVAGVLRGKGYDRDICARVGELTGASPVSVIESVTLALHDHHAARVAVVTPYREDVNQRLKTAIQAEGIEVTAIHGMGLTKSQYASVTPESIYSFVQSRIGTRVPGDALLLACTDYHSMSALSLLKVAYEVPIVTSNLATLQAVKRRLHELRDMSTARARRPAHS